MRASLQTIKLLAEAYPGACDIKDIDGKTPLHLACDSACELFEGEGDPVREPPRYDVVRTLIKTSPLSVALEDQDGMSALEYAIFSDAPIMVIKLLQYETRKQCERQQRKSRLDGKNRPSRESSDFNILEFESISVTIVPVKEGEPSSSCSRGSRRRGALLGKPTELAEAAAVVTSDGVLPRAA